MKYFKQIIWTIGIISLITVSALGYVNLPTKVKTQGKEITKNKEAIKDNTNEGTNYRDVNEEYKRQHMAQHSLLLKILDRQNK